MRPLLRALLALVLPSIFLLLFTVHLDSEHRLGMSSSHKLLLLKRSIPTSLVPRSFLPQQNPLNYLKPSGSVSTKAALSSSAIPDPIYTRTFSTTFARNSSQSSTIMADKLSLFEAVRYRHSIYQLSSSSTIPDERIQELVGDTLLNVPSAFNSQTTRLVLVLKEHHKTLWQAIREVYKQQLPPEKFEHANQRFNMFEAGYGTVLFYEDTDTIREFQEKFKPYEDKFAAWSEQTNGMHQFVLWTALEAEGLGANLQHYNPLIDVKLGTLFDVPESWNLKAQLVFGKPEGERPGAKPKNDLEKSLKVFK